MNAHDLYLESTRRGLKLEPIGDKLAVRPKGKCPPDFANVLRAHKGELLNLLEANSANLTPDCAAWLPVARQILAGEFVGADSSTVASVTIGLRSILHPLCQRALERLRVERNT
jgi:hypothetical protein